MNELRKMAAGVICGGFAATRLDADLEARLRALPLAGVTIFGGNIESLSQLRALTGSLRDVWHNPIIAIDQEGGRVARLRDSVEIVPSMMALSATGDSELAGHAGQQVAFDLRRAGVNLNFAPVLDLALYRMNTVIGTRSFGDDPNGVTRMAGAFAQGLERGGIVPTFKHFPGHGSTAVDSHLDLPVIELDAATLRDRDLRPFADLLPQAAAVMTAHILVKTWDSERPATLSPEILTRFLRDELGFEGVCFTDCLQMDAIAKGIGSEAGAVAALQAGADCMLVSHDLDLAESIAVTIERSVRDAKLPAERLEQAFERVNELKSKLCAPMPIDAAAPFAGIGKAIAARAITRMKGEARVDPASAVAISFEGTTTEGAQGTHSTHPKLSDFAPVRTIALALDPSNQTVDAAIAKISSQRPIVLMRRAHLYPRQKHAVDAILTAHPEAILVSLREPYDAFDFPRAGAVLCTYSDERPSIEALAHVLFEGAPALGELPLHEIPVARAR